MFSSKTLSLVAGLLIAAAASAQTSAPAPAKQGFTGTILGNNVNVRSGPGQAYYAIITLSNPATVQVTGEENGWATIVPPPGSFSLVAKKFVKADGQNGAITAANVRVRAGSEVTPTRNDQVQVQLGVGDKVTILGETGEFYKIIPPPGAVAYVASQYVSNAGGNQPLHALTSTTEPAISVLTGPTGAGKAPEAASKPFLLVTPPAAAKKATPAVAAKTTVMTQSEKEQFDSAERALQDEYKKAPEARDLKALLEKYNSIKLASGSTLTPYVQSRVKFLQGEVSLAKDLQTISGVMDNIEVERAKREAERARIARDIPKIETRDFFAVEGVLNPSGLYPGGATGPKRYTVGQRPLISAYVQCTTGVVDLDKYAGQYVGVVGAPKYDERAGIYVVEAEKIVVLRPGATSAAAKPIDAPKLEPAAEAKPEAAPAEEPKAPAPEPKVEPATEAAPSSAPAVPADPND